MSTSCHPLFSTFCQFGAPADESIFRQSFVSPRSERMKRFLMEVLAELVIGERLTQ
jgi:hypothetical protein